MKKRGARLGQHFLTGTWAAAKLVEAAHILPEDTVLEIGPGRGALTKELLKTGAEIIAVEKDSALVEYLKETITNEKFQLVEGDVRDFEPAKIGLKPGGYILAANIPYYITGEIIRTFLSSDTQPKTMAILIQKEVAQRILAQDRKESILSLSVKAYGVPAIAAKVSKGNFSPPPSVDSAILAVTNISKKFFDTISENHFFDLLHAGFASKRKKLSSNLAVRFDKEKVIRAFEKIGLPENTRAEDVELEIWKSIGEELL